MGIDFVDGICDGLIWVVFVGVVDNIGENKGGGGYIWIKYVDGVMIGYFYMKLINFMVIEGQVVQVGD